MTSATAELMARGASGPPLPTWLWVVIVIVFIALAAYGISRMKRG